MLGSSRSQGIPSGKDGAENAVGSPRTRHVVLPMWLSSSSGASMRDGSGGFEKESRFRKVMQCTSVAERE